MRITFLCSSLEPGRDGVGDYTRLLAEECVRQGHECSLIALHDRHVSEPIEEAVPVSPSPSHVSVSASQDVSVSASPPISAFQDVSVSAFQNVSPPLPLLRLPSTMPWPERVQRATSFLKQFEPDWISLQFVPYGFNDKGLIWTLSRHLHQIIGNCRQHIMFHELWIGEAKQSPLRHRIIGVVQRWFILNMISKLKPALIHTHTPLYAAMLQEQGFPASILPLFGNIPVIMSDAENTKWLWDELAAAGCPVTHENRSRFWLIGFFGTLHPEWEPEPFFSILSAAAKAAGKCVCLLAIGRLGCGEEHWSAYAQRYAREFSFISLGEQAAERISELLHAVDFGVATSPWQLISKSGTAAAMLDHGLSVIVNRDNFHSRHELSEPPSRNSAYYRCDAALKSLLAVGLPKHRSKQRLQDIAVQFLNQLRAIELS